MASQNHPIQGVASSNTGFIGSALSGPIDKAVHITSFSEYEREFGGLGSESPMSYAVWHYFENGGRHAYVVRVVKNPPKKNGGAAIIGFKEIKQGLKAFDQVDLLNLLCIPPFGFQLDVDLQTWKAALEYCTSRRAFLIVDAPAIGEKEAVMRSIPASRDAAVFYPRLVMPDLLNGSSVGLFAPCGAVAGIFARTDTNYGVSRAPAGAYATLVGTLGVSASPSDEDVDELGQMGINCIRYSPSHGLVIWSARTLQSPDPFVSEWKYIPVRRTALYIEESLYRGLHWTASEPNDEPLWAQIRLNVGAFMQTIFQQGALQGTSATQAYFVKCDKETTRQADIDKGITNLLVGFAPLRPAEFVMIKIRLER
jgi:phage tail sheath protein FI